MSVPRPRVPNHPALEIVANSWPRRWRFSFYDRIPDHMGAVAACELTLLAAPVPLNLAFQALLWVAWWVRRGCYLGGSVQEDVAYRQGFRDGLDAGQRRAAGRLW